MFVLDAPNSFIFLIHFRRSLMEIKISNKINLAIKATLSFALGWALVSLVNAWFIIFILIFGLAFIVLGLFFLIGVVFENETLDDKRLAFYAFTFLVGFFVMSHVNNSWYSHYGSMLYNTKSEQLERAGVISSDFFYVVSKHIIPIKHVEGNIEFNVISGLNSFELEVDYIWNSTFIEQNPELDYKQVTVAILDDKVKSSEGQFGPVELALGGCEKLKSEGLVFDVCPLTITSISIDKDDD